MVQTRKIISMNKTIRQLTKEGKFQARAFGLRISYFDYRRMSLAGTLMTKLAELHVLHNEYRGMNASALVQWLNDEGLVTKGNGDPLTIHYVYAVLNDLKRKGLLLKKCNNRWGSKMICWMINPAVLDQTSLISMIS